MIKQAKMNLVLEEATDGDNIQNIIKTKLVRSSRKINLTHNMDWGLIEKQFTAPVSYFRLIGKYFQFLACHFR